MWQTCPICKGIGKVNHSYINNSNTSLCKTCDGKGVISKLTGLSPVKANNQNIKYKNLKQFTKWK